MFCKKCGNKLADNAKFCAKCGTSIENTTPQNINNNISNNLQEGTNIQNQNINNNQMNIPQPNHTEESDYKGIASIIIGIISIISAFFINILVIPIAVIGLILGITDKKSAGKKVAGIILNIIGLAASIFVMIIMMLVTGFELTDPVLTTFKGDGYTLQYDSNWVTGTVYEKEALAYKSDEETYIVPIGKSSLSDFKCDAATITCQTKIYNDFFESWNKEAKKESLILDKKSLGFNHLKEDIYYGTYNYGKSSVDLYGTFYVLFSKEKNVILSFKVQADNDEIEEVNEDIVELLKTIEIEKNTTSNSSTNESNNNSTTNSDLGYLLESMSNWNRFSHLRTGNLGKISYITGGWRILEDSEEYWEFSGGQFFWYKSINNKNDNYWQGTVQILYGKEGLKSVGLDESKVDSIIAQSNGKVTSTDIYALSLTPTKIISGGVDKTSTNLPAGTKWKRVWILVNHGAEGIEAQTIDLDTAQTTYYVKVKD